MWDRLRRSARFWAASALVTAAAVAAAIVGLLTVFDNDETTIDDADVVARVDGEPITRSRLEGLVHGHVAAGQPVDRRQILSDLIDEQLWYAEGDRRHLVPTDAEIDDHVAILRSSADPASVAAALANAAAQGRPMTEDEFWAQATMRTQARREMTVRALLRLVASEPAPVEGQAAVEAYWLSKLRDEADIEILDPALR